MRRNGLDVAMIALVALGLSACGGSEEAPAESAGGWYAVEGLRDGNVQNQSGVLTATPAAEGQAYGMQLVPGPIAVTFVIETEAPDLRARASQNREWVELPTSGEQTVMLGGEGARSIQFSSRQAPNISVRVLSVADCATAPAGTCVPLSAPSAAPAPAPASPAPSEPIDELR